MMQLSSISNARELYKYKYKMLIKIDYNIINKGFPFKLLHYYIVKVIITNTIMSTIYYKKKSKRKKKNCIIILIRI